MKIQKKILIFFEMERKIGKRGVFFSRFWRFFVWIFVDPQIIKNITVSRYWVRMNIGEYKSTT